MKRGPKTQTLIMVPLSELVSKLPAGSNVKLSRVWYESIQETLGLNKVEQSFETPEPQDAILVESLDLTDSE